MNVLTVLMLAQAAVAQTVAPVLEFPEAGLDDPAAYEGYRTRFFRDAADNAVQIYVNERSGRVVHVWADAVNASAGFTARDAEGRPAQLAWSTEGASIGEEDDVRWLEYGMTAPGPVELGAFLLGSMRLERDFQYQQGHLQPFGEAEARQPELEELISRLEGLEQPERRRRLALLEARSTAELRARLRPTIEVTRSHASTEVRVEHRTFDGRNRMTLTVTVENAHVTLDSATWSVRIARESSEQSGFLVRITTDAPTLTPLDRRDIFNDEFWRFYDRLRATDSMRFRRVDRQVKSAALMSYEEKLMAGLPNYATYFGRDMLMSALMLEPVWKEEMLEHVIASVLRKLRSTGEVSHEEALGGQAIRENVAEYLRTEADSLLADLQRVRENYHMVDDDFQFPVVVARYLADPAAGAERKRAFLTGTDPSYDGTRVERLLRTLAFVARESAPYARDAVATNLISFARRPDGSCASASWRDSGAGYGGGCFAMDVNAIWVPAALAATARILDELERLGWSGDSLVERLPGTESTALRAHVRDRATLQSTHDVWRGAWRHFVVEIPREEAGERIGSWLSGLSDAERAYWRPRVDSVPARGVRFVALSLDSAGRPIPIMSTDAAMELFLRDENDMAGVLTDLEPFLRPYPFGLFVAELGPLVANDAFASTQIQEAFRNDHYHSPRVVWGREVNLFLLGLMRHVEASYDSDGRLRRPALGDYVTGLVHALAKTLAAVEASGLKHAELWTYRIDGDRLMPVRYPVSTDIQLWNVTDLAVQYSLSRLPDPAAQMLREQTP